MVTCEQMQRAEEAAFAKGVTAEVLMEEAGRGIADAVEQFFPGPGLLILVLGKGNNAGDALVAGRWLKKKGWSLVARFAHEMSDLKPLPAKHLAALGEVRRVGHLAELMAERGTVVVLDGLLGIGVRGPIRREMASVIAEVNEFRQGRHAAVVALDLPSGLESDAGNDSWPECCVKADITLCIGLMKQPLIEDRAVNHVGRLALIPLKEVSGEGMDGDDEEVLSAAGLLGRLVYRDFDFHKGQAGRVGIVAGSRGMLGAAVLSARGALLAGAGLVTVYVPEKIYALVVGIMPVEVMVKPVKDGCAALQDRLDVLVIGPGMGSHRDAEVLELLQNSGTPMVVDADGLNAIAREGVGLILNGVKAPVLLTPHPGEMRRLIESEKDWTKGKLDRGQLAQAFVGRFGRGNVTLLLKGSRTVIAHGGRPLAFNSTGHPGMASGGMGDVLSGVCGALIGAGTPVYDAACIGTWVCARAAEIAIADGVASQESLTAGTVANYLGRAFGSLRRLEF